MAEWHKTNPSEIFVAEHFFNYFLDEFQASKNFFWMVVISLEYLENIEKSSFQRADGFSIFDQILFDIFLRAKKMTNKIKKMEKFSINL